MKRNYQGVLKRVKEIAEAHPQINSVDDGRELEFDTKKANLWPRFFIRTDRSDFLGGEGTVELSVTFSFLLTDRMKVDRSNMVDVMGRTHSIMTDVLAVMNKEQLVRVEDNWTLEPLYDYQDSQSSGWQVQLAVYLDQGFECYPVP